ncbi:MAG: hypothetical protein PF503_16615 [Desulfobacula sp.]|nr:hypothetical protein [Desulfobacula sp.]
MVDQKSVSVKKVCAALVILVLGIFFELTKFHLSLYIELSGIFGHALVQNQFILVMTAFLTWKFTIHYLSLCFAAINLSMLLLVGIGILDRILTFQVAG